MKTSLHIQQKIERNRVAQEKILDLRNENLLVVLPEIRGLTRLEQVWLGRYSSCRK